MITYTLIDSKNETFEEFIKNLSFSKVIGLSMVGKNIGREGKISWIMIDANKVIYILDIISLGMDIILMLKDIFESQFILKIIHDCRFLSEFLWHKYNINLTNIFDTQIADIIIFRLNNRNLLPKQLKSLYDCITQYVAPEPEDLYGFRNQLINYSENEELLFERPANEIMIKTLMNLIKYLKALRNVQFHLLLKEFYDCINIHRSYFRDAPIHDIQRLKCYPERIPIQFHQISKYSEIAWKKESENIDLLNTDLDTNKVSLQSNTENFNSMNSSSRHSDADLNPIEINQEEYQPMPNSLKFMEDSVSKVECMSKEYMAAGSEHRSKIGIKKLKNILMRNYPDDISKISLKKSDYILEDRCNHLMDNSNTFQEMRLNNDLCNNQTDNIYLEKDDRKDLSKRQNLVDRYDYLHGYDEAQTREVSISEDICNLKNLQRQLYGYTHANCGDDDISYVPQRNVSPFSDDNSIDINISNNSVDMYNEGETKFQEIDLGVNSLQYNDRSNDAHCKNLFIENIGRGRSFSSCKTDYFINNNCSVNLCNEIENNVQELDIGIKGCNNDDRSSTPHDKNLYIENLGRGRLLLSSCKSEYSINSNDSIEFYNEFENNVQEISHGVIDGNDVLSLTLLDKNIDRGRLLSSCKSENSINSNSSIDLSYEADSNLQEIDFGVNGGSNEDCSPTPLDKKSFFENIGRGRVLSLCKTEHSLINNTKKKNGKGMGKGRAKLFEMLN